MNLVVGSSGLLGREICRILCESSNAVRALVRRTTDATKQASNPPDSRQVSSGTRGSEAGIRRQLTERR